MVVVMIMMIVVMGMMMVNDALDGDCNEFNFENNFENGGENGIIIIDSLYKIKRKAYYNGSQ